MGKNRGKTVTLAVRGHTTSAFSTLSPGVRRMLSDDSPEPNARARDGVATPLSGLFLHS
jgi:hypothetical protein